MVLDGRRFYLANALARAHAADNPAAHPPKLPRGHPNRAIECGWALTETNFALLERGLGVARAGFEAFARKTQAAGWCPEEVAEADLHP